MTAALELNDLAIFPCDFCGAPAVGWFVSDGPDGITEAVSACEQHATVPEEEQ